MSSVHRMYAYVCASVLFLCGYSQTEAACHKCGITLHFLNELKEPKFEFRVRLQTSSALTILQLLEQAAWKEPTFKFNVDYYGSIPGYLVAGVRKDQNMTSEGRQPWVFSDANWDSDHSIWATYINDNSIPTTLSSYQPKRGDTVTFNLTQWSGF